MTDAGADNHDHLAEANDTVGPPGAPGHAGANPDGIDADAATGQLPPAPGPEVPGHGVPGHGVPGHGVSGLGPGVDTAVGPGARSRTGPELLDEDSWDADPVLSSSTAYEGRRRAEPRPTRRWVMVGAVLVGLAAAVTLPYALTSSPNVVTADPSGPRPAVSGTITSSEQSTGEARSVSSTPEPSGSTTQPAAPVASTSRPGAPTSSTSSTAPAPPAPPPPPQFQPLTFEGENAELTGSAWDWDYPGASGGEIARNLGDWGSWKGDGVLTVRDIAIPTSGNYRITIYYVHPDNESQRRGILTVSGVSSGELIFDGNSQCCRTKDVTLSLSAGTKTLTFTHPNRRAPSVDKIVISRV
jgi:hypothetical protein